MIDQVIQGFILASLTGFMVVMLVLIPGAMFGSELETRFFPVVKNAKLTKMEYGDPKYPEYYLEFEQIRNCTAIPETFEWYVMNSKMEYERIAVFRYDNQLLSVVPNNEGYYSEEFGSRSTKHKLVLKHRCHPFWITNTVLEFTDLPPNDKIFLKPS